MPYTPTTWTNGSTDADHTTMTNLEQQYTEATLSLNQDLFAPFVLYGLVCTRDGSVLSQLDFTAGVFYILQADGTLRRWALAASHFSTTVPSTTYYFDVNPDGSTSWGTSHSAVTNHMTVCSATTDGSHNILVVTDARQMQAEILPNGTGGVFFFGDMHVNGHIYGTGGVVTIGDKLSLDGGAITSDGSGKLTIGKLSSDGGAITSNGSGTLTATTFSGALSGNASTATNATNASNATNATNASNVPASGVGSGTLPNGVVASYAVGTGFSITGTGGAAIVLGHTSGAAAMTIAAQGIGVALGFKNGGIAGTKLGEIKSSGVYCADGGFATVGGSTSIAGGASFDTFDVSEVYPTDRHYDAGAVICPHGDVFSICEHDNCHAAGIVSTGGALNIGGGQFDFDLTPEEEADYSAVTEPIALAGRVYALTGDTSIRARDMVVSDGQGGVRAARSGTAWIIGYALHDAQNGRVGVFVRPAWANLGRRRDGNATARAGNRNQREHRVGRAPASTAD